MSTANLTTTSHIVLGLVEFLQPATPYDLERIAKQSVMKFWSVPHTQLYSECARLADGGYLDEEREQDGRRRRTYRLTQAGRKALEAWRVEPPRGVEQVRDTALLKLFFGGDKARIAAAQLEAHRSQLEAYEALAAQAGDTPRGGRRAALEYGLAYERMSVDFWSKLVVPATQRPGRGGARDSSNRRPPARRR